MMLKRNILALSALAGMLAAGAVASAQTQWSQATACPGWNNPASFTTGSSTAADGVKMGYSGQGGNVGSSGPDKPCPNPLNATLGFNLNTLYTANQLATVNSGSCGNGIPSPANHFVLMTNLTGTDPNTGGGLKYVPTHFNTNDTAPDAINTTISKSIRIGDGCDNGSSWSGNDGGAALYYTMRVTSQNAMLYLYYAIVAEAPGHGIKGNPTFIIRVMRKTSPTTWQQISDTLAYYISSTPQSNASSDPCPNMSAVTMVPAGQTGWHGVGGSTTSPNVLYKDWEKAVINLSNYIYDTVRVEAMIYDCLYNAHYAYAYIAGECRPMEIAARGCPPGLSTDVGTLTAPNDMLSYRWYASTHGVAEPTRKLNPGGECDYFEWRPLTEEISTPGANVYAVQASDFRVTRRPSRTNPAAIDSVGNMQTFRCEMKSAIDPNKPYYSNLYVNMTNTKPSMVIDTLYSCEGDVKLWNYSEVPGDPNGVEGELTEWEIYSTPDIMGDPIMQYTGDSVVAHFDRSQARGLRVVTHTDDPACYSEAVYTLKPRINPGAGMALSSKELCDAAEATITDTTTGDNRRVWYFLPPNAGLGDTLEPWPSGDRTIVRSFTNAVEPIRLQVFNGLYTIYRGDTTWCNSVATDTISVFQHPELEVTGDTIVCEGSMTNATVRAIGVQNCTYEWSLTNGEMTGNIPAGATLNVVPYADTATYYVKVTSQKGCVAWDSINTYVVRPKLTMVPADGRICPGSTATLIGSDADHYSWTATPDDASLDGQENNAQITVSPRETTVYTLVGHGANDCDAVPLQETVTIVPLAVPEVRVTPGYIDSDNPKVVLRDVSAYSVSSEWTFEDGGYATGSEVTHTFDGVIGRDSMGVVLTAYNELVCPIEYPFSIPVNLFTAWFPNAFTPGSQDANSHFSFFTLNDYEYFHIYIYNRRGELVYESDDVQFKWDGTRMNDGEPMPQGTYVYTCRFRKPGSTMLNSTYGTVTLVR